jgi:hypothetical protein
MDCAGMTRIEELIRNRQQALGVTDAELIRRCGYHNVSKGLRRLDELRGGDFEFTAQMVAALPGALEVPAAEIDAAVQATRRLEREEEDRAWRDAFRPHAIVVCERSIPQPIFVAGFIGVEKILRVDFEDGSAPLTFLRQALDGIAAKKRRWNSESLPAFGRPLSVVVNYTVDKAVEFDLDGRPLKMLDRAMRIGHTAMLAGGRQITPAEFDALIGVE